RGQPATPPDWFRGAVNQLGDEIVTRINNAAVANPINLLSLALLASPKHTMDEVQLRQQLALYLKLLQEAPYGEAVGLAERDPQAIIQYGIDNEFVQRVKHPLGDLIPMETLTALQVTYVRNNSLHLFILPGLISALFRNARRISLDDLHHLVHPMYPVFPHRILPALAHRRRAGRGGGWHHPRHGRRRAGITRRRLPDGRGAAHAGFRCARSPWPDRAAGTGTFLADHSPAGATRQRLADPGTAGRTGPPDRATPVAAVRVQLAGIFRSQCTEEFHQPVAALQAGQRDRQRHAAD